MRARVLAISLVAILGLVIGYLADQLRTFQIENTRLLKELANKDEELTTKQTQGATNENNRPQEPNRLDDARDLISEIASINPNWTSLRDKIIEVRNVQRLLDRLVLIGNEAVPAIREFLVSNHDTAFPIIRCREEFALKSVKQRSTTLENDWLGQRPSGALQPQFDFAFAPTLRLGLMEVLRLINHPSSEGVLVDIIRATRSAFELAYCANLVEEVAGTKYRHFVLQSIHSLLGNGNLAAQKANSLCQRSLKLTRLGSKWKASN